MLMKLYSATYCLVSTIFFVFIFGWDMSVTILMSSPASSDPNGLMLYSGAIVGTMVAYQLMKHRLKKSSVQYLLLSLLTTVFVFCFIMMFYVIFHVIFHGGLLSFSLETLQTLFFALIWGLMGMLFFGLITFTPALISSAFLMYVKEGL